MRTIGSNHWRTATRKRAEEAWAQREPGFPQLAYAWPFALLLFTSPAIAEVNIPVVGQPTPFYGAAGKDVKVEAAASPRDVSIDDSIQFTIRISKLLNAADVQRPDLTLIDEFHRDFQIDDDTTSESEPAGTRVFQYRLRPRHLKVSAIPRFVFPYYDPNVAQPADMPSLPFRKARSELIAIHVSKSAPPPVPAVPLVVPPFAETLAEPSPTVPGWCWWLAATAPPIIAVGWCVAWRTINPVGDRLVRRRRSRAARIAMRTLHSLARHSSTDSASVVDCVALYLAERYDLPGVFRTPNDLASHLRAAEAPAETITVAENFLQTADAVRFAPWIAGASDALLADAERFIRQQEGE